MVLARHLSGFPTPQWRRAVERFTQTRARSCLFTPGRVNYSLPIKRGCCIRQATRHKTGWPAQIVQGGSLDRTFSLDNGETGTIRLWRQDSPRHPAERQFGGTFHIGKMPALPCRHWHPGNDHRPQARATRRISADRSARGLLRGVVVRIRRRSQKSRPAGGADPP